ncbi:hypothetical protein MYK68_13365 [Gordonia sp. PP30]|uniref:hypothetical protein n=1 Tax=unclassified Gordonia (in: high G+C Gram-positive bacteria) TaxID=2657482 RepID=UPI0020003A70|nr:MULTISPECIES: hypothetical protein [unclassified Gordonia (in: high G+C Gram-positive bacteria)]UQE73725.1 hypothetical protein MYK68_13365 [Gordonia sp. PP30]
MNATPIERPEDLGAVVTDLLSSIAGQAAQAPDRVAELFDAARQDAEKTAGDTLRALRDAVEHPDWVSLLILILVKVAELDPEHMRVEVIDGGDVAGTAWARAIGITYTPDDVGPGGGSATLAVALRETSTSQAAQGIILRTSAQMTAGVPHTEALSVTCSSTGKAEFRWPFGGALAVPDPGGDLTASISWTPLTDPIKAPPDVAHLLVGPLSARVALTAGPGGPAYAVTLGIGDDRRSGVHAAVDPLALLGPFGSMVNIAAVDYSPSLELASQQSPRFSLGAAH